MAPVATTLAFWLLERCIPLFPFVVSAASLLCMIKLRSYIKIRSTRIRGSKTSNDLFEYPKFNPWKMPLSDTPLVPYRPFRWGDYHVTMGIKTVSFESWIELDHQHTHYHRLRASRVKQRGETLVQTLPANDLVPVSGFDAAYELVHELAEYLSLRYPDNYSVERHGIGTLREQNGWYGQGRIRTITMRPPIGVTYDLDNDDPMTVAGLLVQDDLALMIEGKDGVYYLRSGAILTAGA